MPQVWKLGNLEAHRKQGEAVDSFAAHYAPPELANGGDVKANPKMDIFSLGLVGLEMLSGTSFIPTSASTKEALRTLSRRGLQADLQSATSALPASHKALLDQMLKVSSDERKSAKDLQNASALSGQVRGPPAPTQPFLCVPRAARRPCRRSPPRSATRPTKR